MSREFGYLGRSNRPVVDVHLVQVAIEERRTLTIDERRRTILHELGHAWNATFVTEATRQDFLALRDLDQWNDDVWQESGNEQAAEILMRGLIEDPLAHRIPETSCAELHEAYELLTGTPATLRQDDCTDP